MLKISRFRSVLVVFFALPVLFSSVFAFADYGRDRHDYGRDRHYYREGRWYRHGATGIEIAVAALALGAYVESLPPRYTTVMVQGAPYYYDGSTYYSRYPYGGYVVVAPPVQAPVEETLVINIPNSRHGYTSVTLRRSGNGFIGPQGEYYPNSPTVYQLRALYGR